MSKSLGCWKPTKLVPPWSRCCHSWQGIGSQLQFGPLSRGLWGSRRLGARPGLCSVQAPHPPPPAAQDLLAHGLWVELAFLPGWPPAEGVMETVCLPTFPSQPAKACLPAQDPGSQEGWVPRASTYLVHHCAGSGLRAPPGGARPPGRPESLLSRQPRSCTCSPSLL